MRPQPLLAATLLVLAATSAGCGPTKAKEAATKPAPAAKVEKIPGEADLTTVTLTPEAEARLQLRTAAVESKGVARTRTWRGEVVVPPGRALIVAAPIAGTLYAPRDGLPTPGTKVAKGQVIFNLVPLLSSEARATFATTRVEAQGQVEQADKQLQQAKVLLERAERLRQQNLGGLGAVEDARSQFAVAESALKAASTRRDAIDQAIKGAEGGSLDPVPIAAEEGGILRNLHVAPGQKVNPGAILFDVVDLDPVHVRVPVYVGTLSEIDEARPAQVGDLSGRSEAAMRPATRVSDPPSGDPLAATIDLFFRVENKDGALRPGQVVGVTLPIRGTKSGLVVPLKSILRDYEGGAWVYEALGHNKFARRRVRIDAVVGDVVSLASGPKPGTQVVTDGAAELFGSEFGGAK